ncbi:MAG: hypothetical protein GF411_10765 [Candidatus Lokiarchaeota archaeon]|nr:hypothetical protein [Candidatus Lokiarchaeota archaeon]
MPSRRTWGLSVIVVTVLGFFYFYGGNLLPAQDSAFYHPAKAPGIDAPPAHHTIVEVSNCSELREALLNVENHTTIFLDDGIYCVYDLPEQQFLTPYGRQVEDIHIRGKNGNRDSVIIEGAGQFSETGQYGIQVFGATDIVIADLTIRKVYYHCISLHPEQGAENITLYNVRMIDAGEQLLKCNRDSGSQLQYLDIQYCSFELSDGWGVHPALGYAYGNGMSLHAVVNASIRDCFFFNLYYTDGNLAGPAILVWHDCIGTIVERCVFINCARGVCLGLGEGEHTGGLIANNFFYRSASLSAPVDTAIYIASSNAMVCHNTIVVDDSYFAPIEIRFSSTTGVVVVNNILDSGDIILRDGATATVESNTNLATRDWFADMDHGDLHLVNNNYTQAYAIDRANYTTTISRDFDGDLRPQGEVIDLGADEFK